MNKWKLPKSVNKPDFIICGAMKSGTTTLHAMLNQHPDIYIPEKEIHFFDMDNILQHPDFNDFNNKSWRTQNLSLATEHYYQWYSAQFSAAKAGQLLGEDSTTYLASATVPQRLAMQDEPVKIIIMLRNPTSRAYSQYWHMLRSGRASYSFEDMLKYEPQTLLNRSLYLSQIKSYYQYVPKDNIKVVIFEQFLQNKQKHLADICSFLGVDFDLLPEHSFLIHENSSKIPKFPKLQWLKNRFFREGGNKHYQQHFMSIKGTNKFNWERLTTAIYRKFNPLVAVKAPKINESTKFFLDDFFKRELHGLNELLGQDILSLWFDDAKEESKQVKSK